jgi:hypothetical protein
MSIRHIKKKRSFTMNEKSKQSIFLFKIKEKNYFWKHSLFIMVFKLHEQ